MFYSSNVIASINNATTKMNNGLHKMNNAGGEMNNGFVLPSNASSSESNDMFTSNHVIAPITTASLFSAIPKRAGRKINFQ
jgi:hypothetical protein